MLQVNLIVIFLVASVLFYVLFGGADFGAGILELVSGKKFANAQTTLINKVIGPVWEANHVWLILIIVILYMGFPGISYIISVHLHLPLLAVLAGVVVRGCSFTFRYYDAIKDGSQKLYSLLFSLSSLWTSLWLGITVASLGRGVLDRSQTDFWSLYIAPWFGLFPLAVGFFCASIFVFLASCYLVGETQKAELREFLVKRAIISNIVMILMGMLVFWSAYTENHRFFELFFSHKISLILFFIASLSLIPLWWSFLKRHFIFIRIFAAGLILCVMGGWFSVNYPHIVVLKDETIDFATAAAPIATLNQLLIALCIGICVILPSIIYLFWLFGKKEKRTFLM